MKILIGAVLSAAMSTNATLRTEGLKQLTRIAPDEVVKFISATANGGSIREQQTALNTLASLTNHAADKVSKALQLDVLEAAAKRSSPETHADLKKFDATLVTNLIALFAETLFGGGAAAGRKIFL